VAGLPLFGIHRQPVIVTVVATTYARNRQQSRLTSPMCCRPHQKAVERRLLRPLSPYRLKLETHQQPRLSHGGVSYVSCVFSGGRTVQMRPDDRRAIATAEGDRSGWRHGTPRHPLDELALERNFHLDHHASPPPRWPHRIELPAQDISEGYVTLASYPSCYPANAMFAITIAISIVYDIRHPAYQAG
jgi:hypothetical protein